MRFYGEPGNKARNVKASERNTIRMPFVAPELSPAPLLARELEKGTKGWTDFDKKVESVAMVDGAAVRAAKEEFEQITCGEVIIRKAPKTTARVRRPRPTKRRWA